jgi:ABC-2 type transport system ATP-binding protein
MKVIEVRNLTKAFSGTRVLNGITFSVDEGEVFGFLGPNGAGKTTTMRILLGLLLPSSGEALVSGESLAEQDELRQNVGALLENDGLYDRLSAYDNLEYYARLYGVEQREERIDEMLHYTGLSDRRNDAVGTFSVGMKRKLGFARAIIHDPQILFLDEPTSGLDPEAQRKVRDIILSLSREKSMTVFLNSHHLDEVEKICSRVAILHRGSIRAYDSMANLRDRTDKPEMEVTLSDINQMDKAKEILSAITSVEVCREADGKMVARLRKGASAAPVLHTLILGGIEVEEVKKVTRSLEEIYLEAVHQQEG